MRQTSGGSPAPCGIWVTRGLVVSVAIASVWWGPRSEPLQREDLVSAEEAHDRRHADVLDQVPRGALRVGPVVAGEEADRAHAVAPGAQRRRLGEVLARELGGPRVHLPHRRGRAGLRVEGADPQRVFARERGGVGGDAAVRRRERHAATVRAHRGLPRRLGALRVGGAAGARARDRSGGRRARRLAPNGLAQRPCDPGREQHDARAREEEPSTRASPSRRVAAPRRFRRRGARASPRRPLLARASRPGRASRGSARSADFAIARAGLIAPGSQAGISAFTVEWIRRSPLPRMAATIWTVAACAPHGGLPQSSS